MKTIIGKFISVGAVALLFVAPLAGQNINCSNCTPPGTAVSGFFVPSASSIVPQTAVTVFSAALTSGSIVSTISGGAVSASVGSAIIALMSGDPGGLTTVQAALNGAGGPTAEIAKLMTSLSKVLAGNKSLSRGELKNITKQFNAMVLASSDAFLTSNNPMLLGVHATVQNLLSRAGTDRTA